MSLTITQAFDLPRPEDIRAMGFVIRLREAAADSDEVRQLVADYVVTPAVERELPRILDDMKHVYDRGEEYGRFIHGSFGSGKSHFMTLLSLLIEGAPSAWDKFTPALKAHQDGAAQAGRAAPDHRGWLPDSKLLVVRLHMLSVRGRGTGLDRAVYTAFNDALKRRGKTPFEFVNTEAVFAEARREAEEYGDVVWAKLKQAGIVGSREDFEAVATGSTRGRERLAKAWLQYKGRDPSAAGVDPRWSEGLKRMAEHAKAQGFGGIVLMIDEFLLWIAEKSGQEFLREINDLAVIVDHATGHRAAPIFVFVARQRNLQEFFPDLVDETKIHEHIDHHAKRFEITKLQDVELRHIVRGRVLKPKVPDAVAAAVQRLEDQHKRILPALLAGADRDYLRDVYPFHPALIEMLVDVTSLMQRERSALRLLYELLVLHYPDLPLGEFLPVGSSFHAIFPESGVEASKKVELMNEIHQQYYQRLAPAMRQLSDERPDLAGERLKALDQIVKTVLLAEVSPRLKQGGLTIERLVQLNAADVEGETFRGMARVAASDLVALSQKVPDLQVAGTDRTAVVRYVLGRVSLGEILTRARSKVDNPAQRFKVYWAAVKKALGLEQQKGFEEGGKNDGDWDLTWRKTRRRGQLKLGNVREMSYDDFEPPAGTFKVLVDYPWDEPGHGVQEDRLRAHNVRKKKGLVYTVCWLPRHMSPTELSVLTDLAAVNFLLSDAGQEELLETLAPGDRAKVIEQASVRAGTLTKQLQDLLVEVYVTHGEFLALVTDVDQRRPHDTMAANLDHIAHVLMDRRYPQHPQFLAEPRKVDLERLLTWMTNAGESNVSVAYDEDTGKVLKTLGQPLELVNLGQSKASLRMDSRYIKDVLQRADGDSVAWAPIAEHLRDTYGLQPAVIDLFLCFLCRRGHRALRQPDGEPMAVKIGMPAGVSLRLQRGALVSAADWHRLRELGHQLFGLQRPSAHRSLQAQDKWAQALQGAGVAARTMLDGLHVHLVHLGAEGGDRLKELRDAIARLAPLATSSTDSHAVLTELLARWPDDGSDPLRQVVQQAEPLRDTLNLLNENARKNLAGGVEHPSVGAAVRDHLAALDGLLRAGNAERPLTREVVNRWNREAQALIAQLIQVPPPPVTPPIAPPPEVTPPRPAPVLHRATLNPTDPDAVSDFLADVRRALQAMSTGRVNVALVTEEDDG